MQDLALPGSFLQTTNMTFLFCSCIVRKDFILHYKISLTHGEMSFYYKSKARKSGLSVKTQLKLPFLGLSRHRNVPPCRKNHCSQPLYGVTTAGGFFDYAISSNSLRDLRLIKNLSAKANKLWR
jgi:hypothetical protein